jgi:hypothetical protein
MGTLGVCTCNRKRLEVGCCQAFRQSVRPAARLGAAWPQWPEQDECEKSSATELSLSGTPRATSGRRAEHGESGPYQPSPRRRRCRVCR